MDKYDLSNDGNGSVGTLSVLEYQGKKSALTTHKKSFNNVYVKGFPVEYSDENLIDLFKEHGKIQNVAIMRDGTGVSKGFGFVCFEDSSSAEKATQHYQRLDADKDQAADEALGFKVSELYVREAKKKSVRVQELQMNNFKYKKSIMYFSLFVKNFPLGTTEEELRIYFNSATQGDGPNKI
jgi:polyadenylate-binding protein